MRLWILIGCGVLIVAGAIWPLARRTEQLVPVPVAPTIASKTAPASPPKPEPAKMVEVIDLARAYEPVREPEEPAGTVNPASFIDGPEQPKPIPPAVDLESESHGDCLRAINDFMGCLFGIRYPVWSRKDAMPRGVPPVQSILRFTPMGEPYAIGIAQPSPPNASIQPAPVEHLSLVPREVIRIGNGLLDYVPTLKGPGELVFTPMGVPYETGITQPIPPNAVINFEPAERLNVMPRVVEVFVFPLEGCYRSDERLEVMPREVVAIQREGQERCTGVREDDFVGLVGPGLEGPVEKLKVMPREVATIQAGLLNFVPTSSTPGQSTSNGAGELVFTPMCVPYATGVTQPIPPGASIAPPVEVLEVMPREVK